MHNYVTYAYCVGFVLLWGYAATLWFETRIHRRHHTGGKP